MDVAAMAQAVECAIAVHQLCLDSQGKPSVWLHPSANRVLPPGMAPVFAGPQERRATGVAPRGLLGLMAPMRQVWPASRSPSDSTPPSPSICALLSSRPAMDKPLCDAVGWSQRDAGPWLWRPNHPWLARICPCGLGFMPQGRPCRVMRCMARIPAGTAWPFDLQRGFLWLGFICWWPAFWKWSGLSP